MIPFGAFLLEPAFFSGAAERSVPEKALRFPASLNAYLKISPSCIVVVGQVDGATGAQVEAGDAVRLPIASVRSLLGVPAEELTGRVVLLADLVGDRREAQLRENHFAAGDRAADGSVSNGRVSVGRAEAVIGAIAGMAGFGDLADPTMEGLLRVIASRKVSTVAELVDRSGYSERHLRRLFLAETGFPPKVFLSLFRFQRALVALSRGADVGLADLAHASGYFDQSHLVRDFLRFASLTPRRFRASMADPYNTADPLSIMLASTY